MQATNLEHLWEQGSQWRDAATYVEISRDEFEAWLDEATRALGAKKWDHKPGYKGVYRIHLSPHVCIEVGSSLTGRGRSMGYARGSMQMRLASLENGRILNKKVQGRSHFKRTKNWASTMLKAAKDFKAAYLDSKSFYDALSEIGPSRADRENYTQEILNTIEDIQGWQNHEDLRRFHYKVQKGGVLTLSEKDHMYNLARRSPEAEEKGPLDNLIETQESAQETFEEQTPTPPLEARRERLLADMRLLWSAARKQHDESSSPADKRRAKWTMDFVASIGKQLKSGQRDWPTDKQLRVLEDKMDEYGL